MAKQRPKRSPAPRPYEIVFQMVIGKWISQAIGTVVEISVPDQLAKGPRRCSDIAREAEISEDGLYRLLRALASVGLFAELESPVQVDTNGTTSSTRPKTPKALPATRTLLLMTAPGAPGDAWATA